MMGMPLDPHVSEKRNQFGVGSFYGSCGDASHKTYKWLTNTIPVGDDNTGASDGNVDQPDFVPLDDCLTMIIWLQKV